jgi:tetratricopeptide (TPR) repeat protein
MMDAAAGPGQRSVSVAGDNYAPITTGDHSPVRVITVGPLPPVSDVSPAPGPVGIPEHVPLFVGRTGDLADLERVLAGGPGVVVQAVHGLGGIGKSALAARYVLLHAGEYSQVVWVSAENQAGIEASLGRFAVALEPQLDEILSSDALAERARAWLAAHDRWLLILDNVNSVNDIAPLLARLGGGGGRFLATSRQATGWHRVGAALRLELLKPGEALVLLAGILRAAPDRLDGGAELCAELGFLPLAVSQAGAYMGQSGLGPRDYLRLLAEYPADLHATGDEDTASERTVARIWNVTLDRLADDPLAGQLLRILAWYAPAAIPRSLLDGLADPPALLRAVGRLAAYSMLTADADGLVMHRLVQAVTRTPNPGDPHRDPQAIADARDQATRQLADAIPATWQDPAGWPKWRMLLPHIDALASHAPPDADTKTTVRLLSRAGAFLNDQGKPGRAAGHLQRVLADCVRLLGPDHPDTLASRTNLAGIYGSAGDLGRAIPLLEQALADCVRLLGPDHPGTLASRYNLAGAYGSAGDLGRAIPLLEQALADIVRVLGPDHPDTLATRNKLADSYESTGNLGRAIPLYEQALADRQRVLGPHHPDTLASRTNLAGAYGSAGDLGRAIPLLEQALADRQRVLGPDHPGTLTSRHNLAHAYHVAGDLGRAIPLYEQALADRQRVLGPDHLDTLITCGSLAAAYGSAGDLGRAIPLIEQTLADRQRVLGPDHPGTLTSRTNLAYAYQAAGDLGRAIPLSEQSLADRQQVLGPDHPDTLASRNNLAHAYQAAGDLGRAIPLYEQALADSVRVLGEDHPQTRIVRGNLAAARHHPQ